MSDKHALPSIELTVTDVKQYFFCPRVIYFTYCMDLIRPTTTKMKLGKQSHNREENLQKRRTLVKYQLIKGERRFNLRLRSERLGLNGVLDMAIFTRREAIPVEFKMSTKGLSLNHKYQLAAYAMLLEDELFIRGKPRAICKGPVRPRRYVRRGFIHYIPTRRVHEVEITSNMRAHVKGVLNDMRRMIMNETMPDANKRKNRCRDCEFVRFCGDIT
ncbi:MAG: CRISPR-associated protein Cas4 [Actinomycetota bacterium]|nr:CRISPR-associated protein Cas4 [Actinomycetota bacterium]